MKTIIQRNLPLDTKYSLIDKHYSSLIDGNGTICENCGRLIANIATVKSGNGKVYNIGFDCLETFLINNSLLDGKSVDDYKKFKKHLPTFIKRAKELKETIKLNKDRFDCLEFDFTDFNKWVVYGGKSTYLTFYYTHSCGYRYNSNIKLSNDVNLNDFLEVVKSINTNILINTI